MADMTELSYTLWRQRRLLELLLYKLEVQQLLLAAGRSRWLAAAAREVEAVLEEMRREELARAVQVSQLADELGLPPEPTLGQIIDVADAPWDEILRDHQAAFQTMTVEVEEASKSSRELLLRGMQATRDFVNALSGQTGGSTATGYSAGGRTTTFDTSSPRTIDRVV